MLVRMIAAMEGPGVSRRPGDEIEIEDREAIRLIEAGFAVPVREAPEPEKAVATKTRRKATRKKR